MSGVLTLSGNEITDAVRTAGVQGDGAAVPGGVGIWPARSNLCANGGFEADLTGWASGSAYAITDSADQAKFGTKSLKSTYGSGSDTNIADYAITLPAAGTYTISAWLYIPSAWAAGTPLIQVTDDGLFSGATWGTRTIADTTLRDQWQRIYGTITVVAGGLSGTFVFRDTSGSFPTAGQYLYLDGVMINEGPVALPYCEGTIPACQVRALASLLGATQGWVAMRIKWGFNSNADPGASLYSFLFSWGSTGPTQYIAGSYDGNTQSLRCERLLSAVETPHTFSSGAEDTVIFAWDANNVYISVNGAAFVSAANTLTSLSGTDFDIGNMFSAEGAQTLSSTVLWSAGGAGTLTNTDTAAINAALAAGKQWAIEDFNAATQQRAACTFSWPCVDDTYVNEAFLIIDPDSTGQSRGILPHLKIELDVTNEPTNPTRVWTDITSDVRGLRSQRSGRIDELQRTQPGKKTLTVKSANAKYDPTNPSGIGIRRTQWIRYRARWGVTDYDRWQGVVTSISQAWPQAGTVTSVVTITAYDAMKPLTLYDLQGATFPAETSDARVTAICTLAGIPVTIDDPGASTLVPISTALPKQSYADQHLQQVELTENGLIFAGPDGAIHFQSRHYRTLHSQTAKATIGDTPGTVLYRDSATVESDDNYLVNLVTVTPTNADGSLGTPEVASDPTSETDHFSRSSSQIDRTILVSDPSEALACAQFLVGRYKEPSPRIPSADLIGSQISRRAPSLWAAILGANNSDRFTFQRSAAGNTITEDCFVEQITETIVPNTSWDINFQLSPADTATYWLAQTAGFGEAQVHTIASY